MERFRGNRGFGQPRHTNESLRHTKQLLHIWSPKLRHWWSLTKPAKSKPGLLTVSPPQYIPTLTPEFHLLNINKMHDHLARKTLTASHFLNESQDREPSRSDDLTSLDIMTGVYALTCDFYELPRGLPCTTSNKFLQTFPLASRLVSMLLPLQPLTSAFLTPQFVSQGETPFSVISHSRTQTQVMSRRHTEDPRIWANRENNLAAPRSVNSKAWWHKPNSEPPEQLYLFPTHFVDISTPMSLDLK